MSADGKGAFGLQWPGKAEAAALAQEPFAGCLEPLAPVLPDALHTFIEGDNLDALKLLLPTLGGEVKLIFIDPPYNTGSDRFVYHDDFADHHDRHTSWCSMMLPRLVLAQKLLREDGVIFITIGDDELPHLLLIMHEVFGEENFVANLLWRRRKTQANLSRLVAPVHDYIVCFAKDKAKARFNKVNYSDAFVRKTFFNPDNDPRGPYQTRPLAQPPNSGNREYALTMPGGRVITAHWSCTPEKFAGYVADKRVLIPKNGLGMPRLKIFLKDLDGAIPNTWLGDAGTYEEGSKEIRQLFGSSAFFISPKPTALMRRLIKIAAGKDDLVMDFFAGSGSTTHAVMQLNAADQGKRKSIAIQCAEALPEKSAAHQQGYGDIAQLCRERICRAMNELHGRDRAAGPALNVYRVCKPIAQ